jgi:type IV pilus assembly protein PilV
MYINNIPMIRHKGYSLLEVLVALVVISIGVLGVAAMQATALSGTHTSQTESLVAIQARSLADAMLANSAFWSSPGLPTSVTVTSAGAGAVTITGDGVLSQTANCNGSNGGGTCTAPKMAAYDLQQWGVNFFNTIPNGTQATINCNTITPRVCTIQLEWSQKATVAMNGASANPAAAATTTASYTLVNQF